MTSVTAKKTESKKTTLQLVLGLTSLLVYAMVTQSQADSSEHAAQIVQAHLAVGDAVTAQESYVQNGSERISIGVVKGSLPSSKSNKKDFNAVEARRLAASSDLDDANAPDEGQFQSGILNAKLAAQVTDMDKNIDALISDMLNLQHQINQNSLDASRADIAQGKNAALSKALTALIEQASVQKTEASSSGKYESFASAEQKVIRLHAQASRMVSSR